MWYRAEKKIKKIYETDKNNAIIVEEELRGQNSTAPSLFLPGGSLEATWLNIAYEQSIV